MENRENFSGGFLLGVIAGFVAGILLAPKAGRKPEERSRNKRKNILKKDEK